MVVFTQTVSANHFTGLERQGQLAGTQVDLRIQRAASGASSLPMPRDASSASSGSSSSSARVHMTCEVALRTFDASFEILSIANKIKVKILVQAHSEVSSLNFTDCRLNDETVADLVHFTNLTELVLSSNWELSSVGIAKVVAKHKYITKLDVSECFQIDDRALLAIFQNLHHLQELDLSGTGVEFTDQKLCDYLNQNPHVLARLSVLKMGHCSFLIDASLRILALCPSLTNLDLSACTGLTFDLSWLQHCTNLKSVNLQAINLAYPKNTEDDPLSLSLPHLEHLDLKGACGVTDTVLHFVKQAKQLKVLNLANTGTTDSGLQGIEQLQNLETLILDNCIGVQGSGFKYIGALSKLSRLSFSSNPNFFESFTVTEYQERVRHLNEGIQLLTKQETLPPIEFLELSNCDWLDNRGVASFAKLRTIKVLRLIECGLISNAGVQKLFPQDGEIPLGQAEEVSLMDSTSYGLTNNLMHSLVRLPKLRKLTLSNTGNLTKSGPEWLKKAHKEMHSTSNLSITFFEPSFASPLSNFRTSYFGVLFFKDEFCELPLGKEKRFAAKKT